MRSSADGGRAWCALAGVARRSAPLAGGFAPRAGAARSTGSRRSPRASRGARGARRSSTTARCTCSPTWPGCALVGALGVVRARAAGRSPLAWLLAWPLTQLGLLAAARPASTTAASRASFTPGVACVGWCSCVAHARGQRRAIGALLLAGLALKVASEAPWGAPLRHPPGWDIATAPFAHASGLVAGLVAALLCELLAGRGAAEGSLAAAAAL